MNGSNGSDKMKTKAPAPHGAAKPAPRHAKGGPDATLVSSARAQAPQTQNQANAIQNIEKKDKGLLGDISFAQVTATALAAVTSTLLSSKIGIAGSLIGVGLGAAASAICSSVYRTLLSRSADKLSSIGLGKQQTESLPAVSDLESDRFEPDGTRIAPDSLIEDARRQQRSQKIRIVLATTIAAIAAVAIGAATINAVTKGNGLGTKTSIIAPLHDETPAQKSATPASGQTAPQQKQAPSENAESKAKDQKKDEKAAQDSPKQDKGKPDAPSQDGGSATSGSGADASADGQDKDAGQSAQGGASSPAAGAEATPAPGTGTSQNAQGNASN